MSGPQVQPFAFDALPHIPQREADAHALARRWRATALCAPISTALSAALGLPVQIKTARFEVVDGDDAARLCTDTWWTPIHIEGRESGALALDPRLPLALVDAGLGQTRAGHRPIRPLSPLEHGLTLAHLAALASALEAQTALTVTAPLERDPRAGERLFGHRATAIATFEVALDDQTGLARVIMPAGELLRALSRATLSPNRDALTVWCRQSEVAMTLTLTLPGFTLPQTALAALEEGGLVVGFADAAPVRGLVWSGEQAMAAFERDALGQIRILGPPDLLESTVTHPPLPTEGLPVEITVEIGRVTLPLSELSALAAGDVLTLDGPLDKPVLLKAGHQTLAKGELVEVAGALGVRITALGDG